MATAIDTATARMIANKITCRFSGTGSILPGSTSAAGCGCAARPACQPHDSDVGDHQRRPETTEGIFASSGVAEPTSSYFDEARLTKAGVTATVELDDAFEGIRGGRLGRNKRTASVFGKRHSIINVSSPGHVVTRCFTANDNSQLEYRSGVRISGTIHGTDVTTIPISTR
jgi:hypothetical protein